MYPNARAHVLSSLAVVLYVPAPTTVMLTAHETVRIDRLERSVADGVTASRHGELLRPGTSTIQLDRGTYHFRTAGCALVPRHRETDDPAGRGRRDHPPAPAAGYPCQPRPDRPCPLGVCCRTGPHGHLLVAFTGHSDREPTAPDKPPAIAWCLHDGPLPLAEVAALLSAVPPTALITVIADTCYAAALSGGVITAAVIAVILSAPVICGQTHQGARQATTTAASAAIICLPPSGDGVVVTTSKSGDPGC